MPIEGVVDTACARGSKVVIPSKRSRKVVRTYDTELYKECHLIENIFRWLKQWRGIATRYAQRSDSFLAALYLRSIFFTFDGAP
ncbi:MAG: hypothetical protein LBO67_09950 [Spirochaetaceae bacterium]|nr:hypothetical protein [Spirochaetaceae bacterium]